MEPTRATDVKETIDSEYLWLSCAIQLLISASSLWNGQHAEYRAWQRNSESMRILVRARRESRSTGRK